MSAARLSTAELIKDVLGDAVTGKIEERKIATLWAGYGSVVEVSYQECARKHKVSVIVKRVEPRDDEEGESHDRKIRSYFAEAEFYRRLAKTVRAAVPRPLRIQCAPDGSSFLFVMTNLKPEYPVAARREEMTWQQCLAALEWLASFHAQFWEQSDLFEPRADGVPGLWEQGSYWYLDTRRSEYDAISRSPKWKRLYHAAPAIDWRLKGLMLSGTDSVVPSKSPKFRTLIHGDYKAANLLFSADGRVCSAHDFQYCGQGYGERDVAYALIGSLDPDVVDQREDELLRHYHTKLSELLAAEGMTAPLLETTRAHYDLCVVDFVRFMAGWGMWGNSSWATNKAYRVLERLDQGHVLTADQYFRAICAAYPLV